MRALVTGATGFIGQRLVKAIGPDVTILARSKHRNYKTIVCDLETDEIPQSAMDGIDTVFHLAALAHDTKNRNQDAHRYHNLNVRATERLVRLALRANVQRFVFVSSVKAGDTCIASTDKVMVDKGITRTPYGESKRQAELILHEIKMNSTIHLSIVRPSLVYGPNLKGNLRTLYSGIRQGWLPPLPDNGNKRSMIHVDDLVRCILLAAFDDRADGETIIATDGINYSTREIYDTLCLVVGRRVPRWSVPLPIFKLLGAVNQTLAEKINKLFGDEHYSSRKLQSLGFKACKSLEHINETDY